MVENTARSDAIGGEGDDRIRVLHVDDDPLVGELVAAYLEGTGDLDVHSARAPAEGLELLDTERFACVVSDYQMPATDGLAFLVRVRDRYPSVPFILYTGRGSEEIASEAFSKGATDYIQKGGTDRLERLENRIRHAVAESAHREMSAREAEKFRAVFEEASDAMLIADDDGRYVDVNPEACALFGVEKEALLGRTAAEFAPDDFDFAAAWQRFRESGRERGRFPLVRPDGETRVVEYSATPDIVPGLNLSIIRPVPGDDDA